jgi:hypothetical protein
MSPTARLRRVPVGRTRPIRNAAVPGGQPAPRSDSPFGVAEGLRAAQRLAAVSGSAVKGAVESGVNIAYTVIDEYMHRGEEAASREREHARQRGSMNDDRYNCNNPYMAWGPMAPLIAPWIQAMQAWMSAMSAFAPGGMYRAPWNPYAQTTSSPNVSVRVTSRHPTEVTTTLAPGADAMTLAAAELRIVDPLPEHAGAPPLNASITCGPRPIQVSVSVPDAQPPGRYRGAIVNSADGTQVGTLLVQISKTP